MTNESDCVLCEFRAQMRQDIKQLRLRDVDPTAAIEHVACWHHLSEIIGDHDPTATRSSTT